MLSTWKFWDTLGSTRIKIKLNIKRSTSLSLGYFRGWLWGSEAREPLGNLVGTGDAEGLYGGTDVVARGAESGDVEKRENQIPTSGLSVKGCVGNVIWYLEQV